MIRKHVGLFGWSPSYGFHGRIMILIRQTFWMVCWMQFYFTVYFSYTYEWRNNFIGLPAILLSGLLLMKTLERFIVKLNQTCYNNLETCKREENTQQATQKYFNKKRNNTVKSTKFHSFDFMWQCSCFHVTWHRHWCYSILSIVPFDGHLLQQHINTLSYGEISAEERESAYFFSNFP